MVVSRFLVRYKFGVFPSVAAAWNIKDEDFLEELPPRLDLLKLRCLYGQIGNQAIDPNIKLKHFLEEQPTLLIIPQPSDIAPNSIEIQI